MIATKNLNNVLIKNGKYQVTIKIRIIKKMVESSEHNIVHFI